MSFGLSFPPPPTSPWEFQLFKIGLFKFLPSLGQMPPPPQEQMLLKSVRRKGMVYYFLVYYFLFLTCKHYSMMLKS